MGCGVDVEHGGGGGEGKREAEKEGKREDEKIEMETGTGTTLAFGKHGRRARTAKSPFPLKPVSLSQPRLGLASVEHAMQGSCRAVGYGKETDTELERYFSTRG